jgi:hypothetical protein
MTTAVLDQSGVRSSALISLMMNFCRHGAPVRAHAVFFA